ncbi:MAG: type II toxin-antitoxin system VapC family toxin [Candidatus Binataceae bacterium]
MVLDSSMALAWIYSDEVTDSARHVFEIIAREGAWVPAIWRLEVANSLYTAVRRGRIGGSFRDAALADLALMEIVTDGDTDTYAWTTTVHLSDRFRLTVYDAAYLELAQRRRLPLASLDQDLRVAAGVLGVTLLGA